MYVTTNLQKTTHNLPISLTPKPPHVEHSASARCMLNIPNYRTDLIHKLTKISLKNDPKLHSNFPQNLYFRQKPPKNHVDPNKDIRSSQESL